MNFTSLEFALFFLAVVLLWVSVRNWEVKKLVVLVASFLFFMTWSAPCVLLILFTSLVDYNAALNLERIEKESRRKRLLFISLAANLGVLGFFKYANFFLANLWLGLNSLGFHVGRIQFDIVVPPGISYYTFASMGYVIDVYYQRFGACRSVRDYLLFVAFFPKLLAGPIVRGASFLTQLQRRVSASLEDIETGLAYLLLGAVKKLVICDQIASNVDLIFATPNQFDGLTLLQGALGYAVQLYCDFSGYSDMAIGCARIMGFNLPENFQMPYSAGNITEFWRRWHISLSAWFRDYVFMPLEVATRGNRYVILRSSINVIVTMLLVGLWHGAGWNFVFWGGIHGISLAAHKAWTVWNPLASLKNRNAFQFVWRLFSRVLTLGVVTLGWIFFRAASWTTAGDYVSRLVTWSREGTRMVSPYILAGLAGVILVHLLVQKDRLWAQEIARRTLGMRILAYSSLAILLACLGATDAAPFIYFRF